MLFASVNNNNTIIRWNFKKLDIHQNSSFRTRKTFMKTLHLTYFQRTIFVSKRDLSKNIRVLMIPNETFKMSVWKKRRKQTAKVCASISIYICIPPTTFKNSSHFYSDHRNTATALLRRTIVNLGAITYFDALPTSSVLTIKTGHHDFIYD